MTAPSTCAPRRRSGHRARAGGCLFAGVAIAVLVCAGCASTVPSPQPAPSASVTAAPPLVVLGLAGMASSIALVSIDAVRPVTAPPGDIQWLASDGRGGLVATLTDGSILKTSGKPPDDPRWRAVPPPPGVPTDPALSFGVPEPAGDGLVALSATYGSGDPSTLVLLGRAGSGPVFRLPLEANGGAPAWLDPGRVIVTGLGKGGAQRSAIVDVRTGHVSSGPDGIRAIAVSTTGGRAAVVDPDGRTIRVIALAALVGATRTGDTSAPASTASPTDPRAIAPPDAVGVATALALDTTGRWLAVVWTDAELVPSVVATYLDDGGVWREASRSALGGRPARAAVAWLSGGGATMPP